MYESSHPFLRFLSALRQAGIRHCLWKSFDRLEEGLRGETDFDLLIDNQSFQDSEGLLLSQGWRKAQAESWRRYPGLTDYFFIDSQALTIYHIHLHTRLVMGDRRLKNLSPPFESLYLSSARDESGVFIAAPELEFVSFLLRAAQKSATFDSVFAQWKGQSPQQQFAPELRHLHQRIDLSRLESLLQSPEFSFLPDETKQTLLSSIGNSQPEEIVLTPGLLGTLRKVSKPFLRHKRISAYFLCGQRFIARRWEGLGRPLHGKGISIAFCGIDGSGKTTLSAATEKFLKKQFRVTPLYLGSSQSRRGIIRAVYRYSFLLPYAVAWRLAKFLHATRLEKALHTVFAGGEHILVQYEQRDALEKSEKKLSLGHFVIFDRFPLFDGFGDKHTPVETLAFPTLVVYLRLNAEQAFKRKQEQSIDELAEKQIAFDTYFESAKASSSVKHVCILDAQETTRTLLSQVLHELATLW